MGSVCRRWRGILIVWSVSFSPDGTKVASRSRKYKMWDSSTGECTFTGEALPNPGFPDLESKATPDVNGMWDFRTVN